MRGTWLHTEELFGGTGQLKINQHHPAGTQQLTPEEGRGVCSHCCHSKSCPSSSSLASGKTPLPSSCAKNSPCFHTRLCWTPGPSSH